MFQPFRIYVFLHQKIFCGGHKFSNKLSLNTPFSKKKIIKDKIGNIITAPETIKNLYVDTYKDRLRNRSMKPELMDIFHLKSELWETRNENLKNIKSEPWEAKDIETVLKSMKNNKSRDPNGMMNELFKEGFIGQDLREALLQLFNSIQFDIFSWITVC